MKLDEPLPLAVYQKGQREALTIRESSRKQKWEPILDFRPNGIGGLVPLPRGMTWASPEHLDYLANNGWTFDRVNARAQAEKIWEQVQLTAKSQ